VNTRDTGTGSRVVATPRALYVQDHPTRLWSWRRLGWERVERVDWHPERAELRLLAADGTTDLTVRPAGPERLLRLARDRVASTTLARVPLRVKGQVVGSVSARRPVTRDGEVIWVVHLAPGAELPPGKVAATIRSARANLGL
jgi:hypothetical protein